MSENTEAKKSLMLALVAFCLITGGVVGAVVIWDAITIPGTISILEPGGGGDVHNPAWSANVTGVLGLGDVLPGQYSRTVDVRITNLSDAPRALTAVLVSDNPFLSLTVKTVDGAPFSSQVVNPGESVTLRMSVYVGPTASANFAWFDIQIPA